LRRKPAALCRHSAIEAFHHSIGLWRISFRPTSVDPHVTAGFFEDIRRKAGTMIGQGMRDLERKCCFDSLEEVHDIVRVIHGQMH